MSAPLREAVPLGGAELLSMCRFSTRSFRNAELTRVPAAVSTVAAMAAAAGCGVHSVLYEVDELSGGAEWCDASRRVCCVFEGEVVAAGLAAVCVALGLPVRGAGGDCEANEAAGGGGGARARGMRQVAGRGMVDVASYQPRILLDPRRWRHMTAQRSSINNRKSVSSDAAAAAAAAQLSSAAFGVFVAAPPVNCGRRRLRPGSRVVVLRPPQQEQYHTASSAVVPPLEAFMDDLIQRCTERGPMHGTMQVFTGDSVWNRIHPHAFATTVVAARRGGGGGSPLGVPGVAAAPRRRMLLLCSVGAPGAAALEAVATRCRALDAADGGGGAAAGGALGVALFADLPSLHCAPPQRAQKCFADLEAAIAALAMPCDVDVVACVASRLVPSPARVPCAALLRLYGAEKRGGAECLAAVSAVACANGGDRLAALAAMAFAAEIGIPYVELDAWCGAAVGASC